MTSEKATAIGLALAIVMPWVLQQIKTGVSEIRHVTAQRTCSGAAYLVKPALDGMERSGMIGESLNIVCRSSDEWEEVTDEIGKCFD